MKRILMLLLIALLVCGCKTADKLPGLETAATAAHAGLKEKFQQLADMNLRAVVQIDLEGAAPHSEITTQSRGIAQAIADYAGYPAEPLAAWEDADELIGELAVANASFEKAQAEYQQELRRRAAALAEWQTRALDAEKENAAILKVAGPVLPVMHTLFWVLFAAIIIVAVAGVGFSYLGKNIVMAVAYAGGGLPLAVAWWHHGEAWVGWGMVISVVVSVAWGLYYGYLVAVLKRLIASIEDAAAKCPAAWDQFKLFFSSAAGQPGWVEKTIARIKLGLKGG